jgi:hypothetical protein
LLPSLLEQSIRAIQARRFLRRNPPSSIPQVSAWARREVNRIATAGTPLSSLEGGLQTLFSGACLTTSYMSRWLVAATQASLDGGDQLLRAHRFAQDAREVVRVEAGRVIATDDDDRDLLGVGMGFQFPLHVRPDKTGQDQIEHHGARCVQLHPTHGAQPILDGDRGEPRLLEDGPVILA